MRFTIALTAALATLSTALAQTERDLDGHEHGHAYLNIAIEGTFIFIELESPWNNLVGFEHEPTNKEQQASVDSALALLNNPTEVFTFDGADCMLTESMLDSNLENGEEHGEHEEHEEHATEKHNTEMHDSENHDNAHHKEHDHDEAGAEGETHTSVLASYNYECRNITNLESIDIKLFELMPGFEELDVQIIGPGGQDATELSAQQSAVDVRQVQ